MPAFHSILFFVKSSQTTPFNIYLRLEKTNKTNQQNIQTYLNIVTAPKLVSKKNTQTLKTANINKIHAKATVQCSISH